MAASSPPARTFLCFTDYCRPSMRLVGADGDPGRSTCSPMIRSALARTARPISRSSILRRCARCRTSRVPPGRRDRDRRVLAAGARARGPTRARADAPEPAAAAHGTHETEIFARRAATKCLRPGKPRCPSSPPAPKSRRRRAQPLKDEGIAARVVSVPSLELSSSSRRISPPGHRRRDGEDRRRGGGAVRMGRDHRRTAPSSA